MEKAFFFGKDAHKLFAVSHIPPNNLNGCKRGIVFCHPYGEEKQMSYRVFVRFARELCNRGFFVLRFDSRGYGDSQGDFEDATIETQICDTVEAVDYAKKYMQVDKVSLLGFRLGATVAALTAEQDDRIEELLLWSPIIKGQDFLSEIFRKMMFAAVASNNGSVSKEHIMEELKTTGRIEVEGHYFTRQIYEQLLKIDLTSQVSNFRESVFIGMTNGNPKLSAPCETLARAYQNIGAASEFKVIDEKDFWDKQSLFWWTYPLQLFKETLGWLRAES